MKKQILLFGLLCWSLNILARPDSNMVAADTLAGKQDTVAATMPVNEPLKLEVNVFPNPATTYATIKLPREMVDEHPITLNLYEAGGQKIYERTDIHLAQVKIMTENLPYGIYYLEVLSGESRVLKKLVVTRL